MLKNSKILYSVHTLSRKSKQNYNCFTIGHESGRNVRHKVNINYGIYITVNYRNLA